MRKILLVHATAGIGHVKAAAAIADALKQKGIPYKTVDILDRTNFLLKWVYRSLYIKVVKYIPLAWALIYYTLDIPWVYGCVRAFRTLLNRANAAGFIKYICETRPDVVVSTHFFSSDVLSFIKRKGKDRLDQLRYRKKMEYRYR